MKGYKRNKLEMPDFADNIATLLGDTVLSAIDSNVRTDLLTAIGTLPADLSAANADAEVEAAQAKAATAAADALNDSLVAVIDQVKMSLDAGYAPAEQYALCGFAEPSTSFAAPVIPNAPIDLSGLGTSNGLNQLKWNRNNGYGVLTEVWRRQGDEGEWGLIRATTKQSFSDTPVTPGQYYEYKVRCVNGIGASAFSGTVVIYGVA